MKRLFLSIAVVFGALSAHADDYSYLTFETTDGDKVSVSTSSLTLSISGTTLPAGEKTFTLSNLSKMYFSTANETTGIESISIDALDEKAEIYDLKGCRVNKNQMQKGVYIVKTKSKTYKMIVTK